jgi:hypothetical protein
MPNQYSKTSEPIKCNVCNKEQSKSCYSYNDRKLGAKSGYRTVCKKCSRNAKTVELKNRNWKYRANEVIYMNAKARAKRNNIPFEIERNDIVIPDVCPVLGIKLFRESKEAWHNAPSIDRIDNTKGYIKNNIMIVSRRANILKRDATFDELIMIGKFYSELKEKQN